MPSKAGYRNLYIYSRKRALYLSLGAYAFFKVYLCMCQMTEHITQYKSLVDIVTPYLKFSLAIISVHGYIRDRKSAS